MAVNILMVPGQIKQASMPVNWTGSKNIWDPLNNYVFVCR